MEQRVRDAGRRKTTESEDVVRECEAMAEEVSGSGWNQVKEQLEKSTAGIGRSQNGELTEKSGRLAKISRTTKLFWEAVLLILMKKIIEWRLNLKQWLGRKKSICGLLWLKEMKVFSGESRTRRNSWV